MFGVLCLIGRPNGLEPTRGRREKREWKHDRTKKTKKIECDTPLRE
jgi:hypothetical protein